MWIQPQKPMQPSSTTTLYYLLRCLNDLLWVLFTTVKWRHLIAWSECHVEKIRSQAQTVAMLSSPFFSSAGVTERPGVLQTEAALIKNNSHYWGMKLELEDSRKHWNQPFHLWGDQTEKMHQVCASWALGLYTTHAKLTGGAGLTGTCLAHGWPRLDLW